MAKLTPTGIESFNFGRYNISNSTGFESQICYMEDAAIGDSAWQINKPLTTFVPILAFQLFIMKVVTRILMFILTPLRQPRFVAEVTAGILLGPSLFGKYYISNIIFPFESSLLLESFANLGLTYYMFLVGLEMDLSALRHIGKKSLSIAIAGICVPLATGAGLYFVPIREIKTVDRKSLPIGAAFWAITLSITSFPDLARILSDVKLLHTDLGRTALASALVSEITAWFLYVTTIVFYDLKKFYMAAIPTTIFLLVCWFWLRPGIAWMISHTKRKEGGKFDEIHISFILAGVAICGCITDACGSHSMIGGFMLGLIIPKGELAMKIMERLEEFVNGIMLPAFILVNGLRTNLTNIKLKTNIINLVLVTLSATSTKIISTLFVSLYFGMSSREGLTLGGLLNTKGVLALIVLNEGRGLKALDGILMLVMVLIVVFMTALVGPIFYLANRTRNSRQYKQRTIQRSNHETEHRILTCIHSTRNLSGIINLLGISNSTRKSPMCVFAVHLVELTGLASAMMVVHDTRKTSANTINNNNLTREKAESEQIIGAFEEFEKENDAVTIHPLTVVSPYTTMHEDIFNLSEDKQVAMILIPFHKQPTAEGGLQGENYSLKEVNKNLLAKAPCSVGILVDRGLRPSIHSNSSDNDRTKFHFAMLFVGGPDDHEALSYAWKMAGTPGVRLTVVRFLQGKDAGQNILPEDEDNKSGILKALTDIETAKDFDDEFINEFRFKTMCDPSIIYHEKTVNNSDEIVESIATKYNCFDLYIVGRGEGVKSPLTMALSEWSDSPELGGMGEALVSSQFTEHASVLVVQQSASGGFKAWSQRRKGIFKQNKWVSPVLNPDYAAFVKSKSVGIK